MVFHHLGDLSLVDFNIGSLAICRILLRQMGLWQKWLSNWAKWWNIPNLRQPNPSPRADGTPLFPQGSFIDVSAQRDYGKKQQRPQSKIDVFDVPIKVEETFEAAREKVDEGFVQFKTALATPEKNNKGGEEDVFYIFYESEGDSTTAASTTTTTLPSVKARVRPTSPRLKPFVVEEPKDSKFTPPSADDIRTIYVPIENAINVPEHFDIRYCVHPSIFRIRIFSL